MKIILENVEEKLPDNFKQPTKAVEATDEDVKEFFKVKGESVIETILKEAEPGNVEVGLGFEEVMAKLAWMKKEVKNICTII